MTIHDHVAELSAIVATLQTEVTALRAGRRRSRVRALVPILTLSGDIARLQLERHVCIGTTAAAGNASLMAAAL